MTQAILWVLWFPALLNTVATTHPATDDPGRYHEGKATFYSPGLMNAVAHKRGIALGGASGYATYPDCREIGNYLQVSVLNPKSGKWSEWSVKRIVDCSRPRDYARHKAEGLVELAYSDAVLYGYNREGHTSIRYYLEGGGK